MNEKVDKQVRMVGVVALIIPIAFMVAIVWNQLSKTGLVISNNSLPTISFAPSRYVGTWRRDAGMFSTVVIINNNGTGNFSGSIGSGGTLIWHEEGDHIAIEQHEGQKITHIIGMISDDSKGLTVSANGNSFILTRQQ